METGGLPRRLDQASGVQPSAVQSSSLHTGSEAARTIRPSTRGQAVPASASARISSAMRSGISIGRKWV